MCGMRPRLRGLLAGDRLIKHAHDVALFHDDVIDAVDLDLGAGPFSEQHAVASLQVDGYQLAVLVAATRTDRDDLAFGGFLLCGIGNDNPACGLVFGVDALDHDAVVNRTKLHINPHKYWWLLVFFEQRLITSRTIKTSLSPLIGLFLALCK